ncbi:MAG: extensin family protein [Magnetospirillum sp.]|nr:extensin family protein [Magnetospirillum sp.]
MSIRPVFIVFALAVLAGCGAGPGAYPPLGPPLPLASPDAACLGDLSAARVAFEPAAESGTGACAIANPVRVSAAALPWNRPGLMACSLARTLSRFETQVVQPLALAHFGQPVIRLHHLGTYDCRTRRNATTAAAARSGNTSAGGRLSEHSRGLAIDVSGFELADGSLVTVARHWRAGGSQGAFLHALARESCRSFNVVLTPNHDRFHQDHLHLDIGPNTLCGY